MKRPIIGVTCGTDAVNGSEAFRQNRINQAYLSAVWDHGGAPMALGCFAAGHPASTRLEELDGLLLSGGLDVDPQRYGESPHNNTVEIDRPRDGFEMSLIAAAVARDLPILAICRGIQVLNVARGGSLWQDLQAERPTDIRHRQAESREVRTHMVEPGAGSLFAAIVGTQPIKTNSFHHQAVRRLGDGLVAAGWAEDGIVEAAEMPGQRFVLAVQFHPEETSDVCRHSAAIFAAFVKACES